MGKIVVVIIKIILSLKLKKKMIQFNELKGFKVMHFGSFDKSPDFTGIMDFMPLGQEDQKTVSAAYHVAKKGYVKYEVCEVCEPFSDSPRFFMVSSTCVIEIVGTDFFVRSQKEAAYWATCTKKVHVYFAKGFDALLCLEGNWNS